MTTDCMVEIISVDVGDMQSSTTIYHQVAGLRGSQVGQAQEGDISNRLQPSIVPIRVSSSSVMPLPTDYSSRRDAECLFSHKFEVCSSRSARQLLKLTFGEHVDE